MNEGGILGLFLGVSILSFFEVIEIILKIAQIQLKNMRSSTISFKPNIEAY
jgi:hypothetical protein